MLEAILFSAGAAVFFLLLALFGDKKQAAQTGNVELEVEHDNSHAQLSQIRTGKVYVDSVTSVGGVHMSVDSRGVTFRVAEGGHVKGRVNGKPFRFDAEPGRGVQEFTIEVET